jgi:hypothetical protein
MLPFLSFLLGFINENQKTARIRPVLNGPKGYAERKLSLQAVGILLLLFKYVYVDMLKKLPFIITVYQVPTYNGNKLNIWLAT